MSTESPSCDEVLGLLSHEIRTYMTSLILQVELLKCSLGEEARPDQTKALQRMQDTSMGSLQLLDSILHCSSLKSGAFTPVREKIILEKLLEEIIDEQEPHAHRKNLVIVFERTSKSEIPAVIMSDPLFIKLVIRNLVGNAIKFSVQGRIVIRLSQQPMGSWDICVEDTGIGIKAEHQQKIFEPFEQIKKESQRSGRDGFGLGLAIAQKLMNSMDSSISLQSEHGKGSIFIAHLKPLPQNETKPVSREETGFLEL